jgi:hypothetical protein
MLHSFDPSNKVHVEWLRDLIDAPVDKKQEIFLNNPMKKESPPFEMIQIIFGLSMKYTKAVFANTAYQSLDSRKST